MATVLDTHRIARRFKEAGVPDAHADAMLDAMVEWRAADVSQLASKDDLRLLGAELKSELAAQRAHAESIGTGLKAELATIRAELRAEIASSKTDILKWIIPLLAGQILALMALVVQLALKGP